MSEVTPETSQQQALAERNRELNTETLRAAQDLFAKAGEKPTAQLLTMHSRLNEIIERTELEEPQEIEAYTNALFDVLSQMADGLVMGNNAQALERQQKIAKAGSTPLSLAREVKAAIVKVGGSVGPAETRLVSDTKL